MPIFTTVQAKPNVTPSDLFREHGNTTDMPCPISESPVFMATITTNPVLSAMRGNLQYHIAANVLQRTVKGEGFVEVSLRQGQAYTALTPHPPLGIHLSGMNSPDIKKQLNSLGFLEEQIGSRKFYRGLVGRESLNRVLALNPAVDTNVPYGVTNLSGLMTFFWLNTLVYGGYKTFPDRASKKGTTFQGEYGKSQPLSQYDS